MLIIAIVLFLLAAVVGVMLLVAILQGRPISKVALSLHGTLAFVAIMLLIISMLVWGASPLLIISLSLFIIAAIGGLTLATLNLNNKNISKLIAVLHPLVAVAGVIALIVYVLP